MNVFSGFFKSYEDVLLADRIRHISLTSRSLGQDMEHAKSIADYHAMEDETIMRMETPVHTPDPSPTRTQNEEYRLAHVRRGSTGAARHIFFE